MTHIKSDYFGFINFNILRTALNVLVISYMVCRGRTHYRWWFFSSFRACPKKKQSKMMSTLRNGQSNRLIFNWMEWRVQRFFKSKLAMLFFVYSRPTFLRHINVSWICFGTTFFSFHQKCLFLDRNRSAALLTASKQNEIPFSLCGCPSNNKLLSHDNISSRSIIIIDDNHSKALRNKTAITGELVTKKMNEGKTIGKFEEKLT